MQGPLEWLGRLADKGLRLDEEYDRLLQVLAGVSTGEIDPRRVVVDLANRSWTLANPLPTTPPPGSDEEFTLDDLKRQAAAEQAGTEKG